MEATIETIHSDLLDLKKDMDYIKTLISEDFELSDHAKNALSEARETSTSEYIDLQ